MSKTLPPRFNEIVCIGAGISGVCLGAQLKRKYGFTDIHFYDRNARPGGTWEANNYPGCACDITALYYSLSFETKDDWSSLFPYQPEIRDYVGGVVNKYDLRKRMTFGTEVQAASWDDNRKIWTVQLLDLATGLIYTHECRILFSAVGALDQPHYPVFPGIERFNGPIFHTARWREDVDLQGKDVVFVGNGASAVQSVPKLVPITKSFTHIIRQPHWILPRENPQLPPSVHWALKHIPGLTRFVRAAFFIYAENTWRMFLMTKDGERMRKSVEAQSTDFIKQHAPEKYHDVLIPDWPIACKRRLWDDNGQYLTSMNSPHYELTKAPVVEILPDGVRTAEKEYPADAIVLATGFVTNKGLGNLKIQGRNGESLDDHWKRIGGPGAYHNTAVHGFPNFLILYGPNSSTGHTSVIFTIESQVRYALKMIEPIIKEKALTFEVKKEAERTYIQKVQEASKTRVFYHCKNWYVRSDGWNGSLYPWTQIHYWWRSHRPRWSDWTYQYIPQRNTSWGKFTVLLAVLALLSFGAYNFDFYRNDLVTTWNSTKSVVQMLLRNVIEAR